MPRILQVLRLRAPQQGLPFALAWHGGALLLVLLAPAQLWRGQPAWTLAPAELVPVLVAGGAYLALALCLALAARRPAGLTPFTLPVAGLACYGGLLALLWLRRDLPFSWGMMAVGAALGVGLALLPWLAGRAAPWALSSLVVALGALGVAGWSAAGAHVDAPPQVQRIGTALHTLELRRHVGVVDLPLESDGGGLAAVGDDFLLVTGAGRFYRLAWSGQHLNGGRLEPVAPLERTAFLADKPRGGNASRLRVTDLLVETSGSTLRVFVAHQFWHRSQRCFTLRVSATELALPLGSGGAAAWRTVYDSRPCLAAAVAFDDSETGGRLAFGPGGGLLLTVGEHGFHGNAPDVALAQDDGDYGKVLLLDGAGGARIFSRGHRNPQGLTVDRAGRIWSTEHGPQGGDEINLVSDGGNYGWPFATYGTDYGLDYWPLADAGRGPFVAPVHAFVPSIGISDLIQVAARQFPRWDGDLLVASLRAGELLRVRLDGTRVAYVEPIPIGRRIRDLAQGSDGRILLWIDDGELVSLAAARRAPSGEAVYRRCAGCHEQSPDGVAPSAPALHGIVGRQVAAAPGFAYSDGLRQAGGNWSRERLDAFLADPPAFAPGTPMARGAVPDGAERRALLDYLAQRQ